jgi:protein TonB
LNVRSEPPPPLGEVGPGPTPTITPKPVELRFVGAAIDPRYAGDFQPDYPDTARDAGREGVVQLRVRIGVDGRVKQVERISGDDMFWRVASRHALARWRFTPATRGDVPEESWRVMTVRFRLD